MTDTIQIGPFLGINNRLPDFSLSAGDSGNYLRSADNVDIDDAGNVRRRSAVSLAQAMSDAHSLKMTSATTGFLVRGGVLYAITLPAYSETLLKVLTNDTPMCYANLADDWYFSNGTDSGRVTAGVVYPIGLPTPAAPALASIGGSLEKGWYQVTVSHANSVTGEEGGVATFASHELTSLGGIRVTLPGATAGADVVNIYLSAANGGVPQLAATVAAGTATHDLIALATGPECSMRHEEPLPAGSLFIHNGRLCSFKAGMLCVGLPYRLGYYLPTEGYIPFPADISVAVPNQGGVYVAADQTYFIPGDLGNVEGALTMVLPYGAVPGTAFELPDEKTVGWFGAKGFVLADSQGSVKAPMANNVKLTPPASGTAEVYECDGYTRACSCGWTMNVKSGAATTYSNWDFTSLSGCYGTKDDGIYLTRADGEVDASVGLGKQNFGTELAKRLPAVYLGVDSAAVMNLHVQAPGGVDYTYPARDSGTDLQQQRIDPGRGLLANWYDLTLSNTDGADFNLASASFAPFVTTRRI